jgi:hypothetical protein
VIEHLHITVSWNDGRVVTLDVSVHEALEDRDGAGSLAERVVHPLDRDQLESDDAFRLFVQTATKHVADGEVVRVATLEDWRGLLLDRLGIGPGPVPDPIPYNAEADRA